MTTAIARWFSIAAMNAALVSPALAMDHDDQEALISPDQDAAQTHQTLTISETIQPIVRPANDTQINVYDDPFTFNALSRITLKQLRVDANASQPDAVKDPFQPINRKVFQFNSKVDQYVLLPVAKAYKNKMPAPVQTGIGNFFSNLREPWNAVNHLLQGDGSSSYKSLGRFTVNTVSSLGLADPATKLGFAAQGNEDFGQTLGKWGVKSGPFLMLPLLGPSTLRDGTGRILDAFGRPAHYLDQNAYYWGLLGVEGVDARAKFIGVEDLVQGDQYALLRDLYLQRRQYLISGNEQNANVDNSFGDEDASFGDDPDAVGTGNNASIDETMDEKMDEGFGDSAPESMSDSSQQPAPASNDQQDTDSGF
ncbi:MAG: VacJ family lipoprotein [Moraxellaceae bacterium]|nr:MAG: VacJ family lipoprotein [Moraxellaceae bacterium]